MTLYLLDENVLREMRPGGDANVAAWLKTIDDNDLRISAITFYEKRKGWERQLRKKPGDPDIRARLAAIAALETVYAARTIPMGVAEYAEQARLLGAKDKDQNDMALAATARVHGLVLVTRNVKDFQGRDVDVLNPFKSPSKIERV